MGRRVGSGKRGQRCTCPVWLGLLVSRLRAGVCAASSACTEVIWLMNKTPALLIYNGSECIQTETLLSCTYLPICLASFVRERKAAAVPEVGVAAWFLDPESPDLGSSHEPGSSLTKKDPTAELFWGEKKKFLHFLQASFCNVRSIAY